VAPLSSHDTSNQAEWASFSCTVRPHAAKPVFDDDGPASSNLLRACRRHVEELGAPAAERYHDPPCLATLAVDHGSLRLPPTSHDSIESFSETLGKQGDFCFRNHERRRNLQRFPYQRPTKNTLSAKLGNNTLRAFLLGISAIDLDFDPGEQSDAPDFFNNGMLRHPPKGR
jgi:hypothetical protein